MSDLQASCLKLENLKLTHKLVVTSLINTKDPLRLEEHYTEKGNYISTRFRN